MEIPFLGKNCPIPGKNSTVSFDFRGRIFSVIPFTYQRLWYMNRLATQLVGGWEETYPQNFPKEKQSLLNQKA
jgi:hypothetical protein